MNEEIQTLKLSKILNDILSEVEKYPLLIKNRDIHVKENPINLIFIDVIVRLSSHLNVLKIVFQNIQKADDLKWMEHSIGVCLRSCLLDRIMINEIILDLDQKNGWDNHNEKHEIYLKHNSGQIKYIIDLVSKKDFIENTKIDSLKVKQNLVKKYRVFFEDENSFKLKYNKTSNVFFSSYNAKKSDRVLEDSMDILSLWLIYSKYEHYGPLSSELLNLPLHSNWNTMISSLMHTTNTFVNIFSCLPATKKSVPFIISKIDELFKLKIKV